MTEPMTSVASSGERPRVVCSAPGKVLLAGGYLVLEPPNIGLTVATSAKFHTIAEWERVPVAPEEQVRKDGRDAQRIHKEHASRVRHHCQVPR